MKKKFAPEEEKKFNFFFKFDFLQIPSETSSSATTASSSRCSSVDPRHRGNRRASDHADVTPHHHRYHSMNASGDFPTMRYGEGDDVTDDEFGSASLRLSVHQRQVQKLKREFWGCCC